MKNWPWMSLLLAIVHALAGVAVLIVSSWFIAACAIASVNFNYMLPAVVIRALALLRIASGYGHMWLGHSDLLARTGQLRLQLFQRLQNKRMAERTWLIEALANHTETIASVWVAWVAQQASAIAMLAVGIICSVWLGLQGAYGLYVLAAVWFALTVYTLYRGIQLAAIEASGEREFRFASEHFLAASSLWHILLSREGGKYRLLGAPSAQRLWQTKRSQQQVAERAVWLLVGASFLAVWLVLARAGDSVLAQPPALIIPLLLLSAPEWLGRALTSLPAYNRYYYSSQTVRQLHLIDCPPIDAPDIRRSLRLEQLSPREDAHLSLSVTLPARGIVQLSGSSGSGKSSLLQALAGHIPARGERLVDGVALPAGLVRQWGYCEQSPIVLQATLRANLALADDQIPDQKMRQILADLGLGYLTDLNEWLGIGGRQLSGGEQKRIALARLLLSNKSVYLLDEPFEALDSVAKKKVASVLNRAGQERLLIVATHIFPESLQVSQSIALD
ncbi:ATP-binding cassette domain-containing protein [Gilvimarinus agarilyticus]|uniref:ATP-binding cassette domain-containing protein n=1 Tax=Gilvimarinus sp. 2_MG-2023 TaxID=3062666 RepID=UPI001C097142|nr:ATP-binding cassette domain-containing protein [Gilvimarinus sp. 2_MG-2023]MBU2886562.1 ATP-binding cassette domain-containing protein [Gilvimarinus agarilyticus]MDO6571230.1 ATP-binding cassette domain-containing protein [Gilvimarinus sp. 2_MG-2023]